MMLSRISVGLLIHEGVGIHSWLRLLVLIVLIEVVLLRLLVVRLIIRLIIRLSVEGLRHSQISIVEVCREALNLLHGSRVSIHLLAVPCQIRSGCEVSLKDGLCLLCLLSTRMSHSLLIDLLWLLSMRYGGRPSLSLLMSVDLLIMIL